MNQSLSGDKKGVGIEMPSETWHVDPLLLRNMVTFTSESQGPQNITALEEADNPGVSILGCAVTPAVPQLTRKTLTPLEQPVPGAHLSALPFVIAPQDPQIRIDAGLRGQLAQTLLLTASRAKKIRTRAGRWVWFLLAAALFFAGVFGVVNTVRPDLIWQWFGTGFISQDIPPIIHPYYERAMKGDAAAMRILGVMYYHGLDVPKDQAEGLRWYKKAAKAGSKAAVRELEIMQAHSRR